MRKDTKNRSLIGRTLYVPRMSIDGASAFAAAYRAVGIDARLVPPADQYTNEMARQYTLGEECYPQIVTLGSFLKIIEQNTFDPQKTAFIMPTTGGPCRFGQYNQLLEKILAEKGLEEVMVISPSSNSGYEDIGEKADNLYRYGWWAVVCSDILRKLLYQTRPFEINSGETDQIHQQSTDIICAVIEKQEQETKQKRDELIEALESIAARFAAINTDYHFSKPLIGVVGEIYCRLDGFANAELIRRIEKFGGEVWLASVAEWVWYTNFYQQNELRLKGALFSLEMLGTIIRSRFQQYDEHRIYAPLQQRFKGYEEPKKITTLLNYAKPYLPYSGVVGEMVLNVGGAIYLHSKGADGIIDISPFTCMNGIVSEAIYPAVSSDYDNIPIKNFYFDETESEYDRDIEIFIELARSYQSRKRTERIYPEHFRLPQQQMPVR